MGLGPFVDREIQTAVKAQRIDAATLRRFVDDPLIGDKPATDWDVAALLKLIWETRNDVFRTVLGRAERNLVSELRDHRNNWAHQKPFSGDDAYRALDTTNRLLTAVSAPQAADVEKLKMELLRVRYDEQARGERRKQASLAIERPNDVARRCRWVFMKRDLMRAAFCRTLAVLPQRRVRPARTPTTHSVNTVASRTGSHRPGRPSSFRTPPGDVLDPATGAGTTSLHSSGSIIDTEDRSLLPEISRFLGVVIAMYYNDHDPAHFHARYSDGQFRLFADDAGNVARWRRVGGA